MQKWKTVKIRQELIQEIEKEVSGTEYQSLSEFVSEAIRLRLQAVARERIPEYLERDRSSRIPQVKSQLYYTPKHLWAEVTPQKTVRFGITDYFQRKTKEIVGILTDNVGEKVSEDEPFGVIETWWSMYDLYPPLSGKIVSINRRVLEDPLALNTAPYHWIVEVQPIDTTLSSWTEKLLGLEEYEALVTKLEGVPTHNQNGKLQAQREARTRSLVVLGR